MPVRAGVGACIGPFIDRLGVCIIAALVSRTSGAWNGGAEAELAGVGAVTVSSTETGSWTLSTPRLPAKNAEAKRIGQVGEGQSGWSDGDSVFVIVTADDDPNTGNNRHRINGNVTRNADDTYSVDWETFESEAQPKLVNSGVYVNYAGAALTAHAFDRVTPGLGKWLVVGAAWLFALSTMISWSYYGEQGVVYLFGDKKGVVLGYKLLYCCLVFVSTLPFIRTDEELDMWTTLGLGAMLVANIPIMWIFGAEAMKSYHTYIGKLKRGEFQAHAAADITEVVEGKDHD